jgi:leucyl-tRNA---protein transferase
MKILFFEANHNYENYFFPYQVLLTTKPDDDLTEVYQLGFLPFRNRSNLFYLSRSCRSNLENFSLSSENKRVIKKTKNLKHETINLSEFKYTPEVQRKCKHWANESGWSISASSIKTLFKNHFYNQVSVWKDDVDQKIIGYSVGYQNKDLVHIANVFYDPQYHQSGLVNRMLIETAKKAQNDNLKFAYMGTCYSLHKRNIPGFEFFNGFAWTKNTSELKFLNKRDKKNSYTLKEKEYLDEFWHGSLKNIIAKNGLKISL